ncbi:MAG: hypothetical protein FJ150_08545 [Euryarchaeota archaeon]|nr:hypothetical protein [Euryarchaeota archaeon]
MKTKDLEIFYEGTPVGELIQVDIVFKCGHQIAVIDELRKTKIIDTVFSLVIDGRFNYVKIDRNSIAMLRITIKPYGGAGERKHTETVVGGVRKEERRR